MRSLSLQGGLGAVGSSVQGTTWTRNGFFVPPPSKGAPLWLGSRERSVATRALRRDLLRVALYVVPIQVLILSVIAGAGYWLATNLPDQSGGMDQSILSASR